MNILCTVFSSLLCICLPCVSKVDNARDDDEEKSLKFSVPLFSTKLYL